MRLGEHASRSRAWFDAMTPVLPCDAHRCRVALSIVAKLPCARRPFGGVPAQYAPKALRGMRPVNVYALEPFWPGERDPDQRRSRDGDVLRAHAEGLACAGTDLL